MTATIRTKLTQILCKKKEGIYYIWRNRLEIGFSGGGLTHGGVNSGTSSDEVSKRGDRV